MLMVAILLCCCLCNVHHLHVNCQGYAAVCLPGCDGRGSVKPRENHKVCKSIQVLLKFQMHRSAYLFAHDPNTVKSELNKAMAMARSKSDLG